MTKIAQTNVNGINYAMAGASLTGTCSSPASDYMKLVTLTDSDSIEDGVTIACTFAHENSAGTAPSSLTLYSADQIHFYTDAGMTELYTLAPSGCFELTYTGSGNAYSYISYPVVAVGTLSGIVSAPVCDSHGNVTSRRLWKAGDVVFLQYKSRKFFVLNDGSGNSTAGVAFKGTRSAYNTAKLIPEGSDGHIPSGALVIITDEGKTYVTNGTGSSQTLELVANATFNGSHAEWNNLTSAQKAMYNIVNFTDDEGVGINFYVQNGTITLPQINAHSAGDTTVTFSKPMPNAKYFVTFDNLITNQGYRILTVGAKTVNGFSVRIFNADVGSAHATTVDWHAFLLPQ